MKLNASLSVEEAHPENPVAIVFVHGNSMSKKIWQKQLQAPELDAFHLISFDLPGHGESSRMEAYSIASLADSLIEICNQLNKPLILAGHSLGADMVLQGVTQIPNCRGIVLVSAVPVAKPMQADLMQPKEAINHFFSPELTDEQGDEVAALLMNPGSAPFIKTDLKHTDGKVRSGILQSIMQGDYLDETEILKNLRIPVALFWGEQEPVYNAGALGSIPGLKPVVLENALHCPQWDNPTGFNNNLLKFAASLT